MKKNILIILVSCFQLSIAQDIETVAGNGYCCNTMDNVPATTTSVYYPNDVAVDAAGNIFISEANRIRKVDLNGIITIYAGSTGGYSGDGGPAISAKLESSAVAVDNAGNVYTADWFTNRVRKINTAGIITTICGNGNSGYNGDGILAVNATLSSPDGLAIDAAGNIYIADTDNNRIRKISTSGIISTVAGNGNSGFSGDGGSATAAILNHPVGVAVDVAGNIYIADWQNNRIRKVNTSGIINTIAGTGVAAFSGDAGAAISAELKQPCAVACDQLGNVFIADDNNQRIRMVNSGGIINTIAGTGIYGYSGDGGPAILANLMHPWGLCTDSYGNVYFADNNDNRVRKIYNVTGINDFTTEDVFLNLYPNPSKGQLTIETNHTQKNKNFAIVDITGKEVHTFSSSQSLSQTIDISFLSSGLYLLKHKESLKSILFVKE